MSLKYSRRAIIGLSELYRPFNEIKVYVEDDAGRLIHERILECISGGSIIRVFPLGGRQEVIKEWEKRKSQKGVAFVIDGDLNHFMTGDISEGSLFQIKAYCIENILINSNMIGSVLEDYIKKSDVKEIVRTIDELKEIVVDRFLGLFILYAIAFDIGGIKTVSDGAMRFLTNDSIDKMKVYHRKRELIKVILDNIGIIEYKKRKIHVLDVINDLKWDNHYHISGKGFIFPLLHKLVSRNANYRGDCQLLIRQVSRYFRSEFAPAYRDFIQGIGRSNM